MLSLMAAQKLCIALSGGVPALVFHKGIVCPQVHRHGCTTGRAVRYQSAGDFHILLLYQHLSDHGFVVVGLLVAGLGTLPQAIVTLRVEQPTFLKPSPLEAVVYIGRQNKIDHCFQRAKALDKPASVRPDND